MSTNAAIGMTMPDGTIKAVYLHWDGYIAHGGAGETLAEHYKEREKVEKLIALGFLSSLGTEIEPDPAPVPDPESVEELPGRGVSALVEGRRVFVGNHRLMNEKCDPASLIRFVGLAASGCLFQGVGGGSMGRTGD